MTEPARMKAVVDESCGDPMNDLILESLHVDQVIFTTSYLCVCWVISVYEDNYIFSLMYLMLRMHLLSRLFRWSG